MRHGYAQRELWTNVQFYFSKYFDIPLEKKRLIVRVSTVILGFEMSCLIGDIQLRC